MDIWDSGLSVQCIQSTFDSYVSVQGQSKIIRYNSGVSQKRLVAERIGRIFGHRGYVFSVYAVLLTVTFARYFGILRFGAILYLENSGRV